MEEDKINKRFVREENSLSRKFFFMAIGALIVIFGFSAVLLHLSFWPRKAADITKPIIVQTNPVISGSVVQYEVSVCRHTSGPAEVQRILVRLTDNPREKLEIPIGSSITRNPKGCRQFVPTNVLIPSGVPSDEYYIRLDICYQMTVFQRVCGQVFSESFFVISRADIENQEVLQQAQEQRTRIEQQRIDSPSQSQPIEDVQVPPAIPSPSDENPSQPTESSDDMNNDDEPILKIETPILDTTLKVDLPIVNDIIDL